MQPGCEGCRTAIDPSRSVILPGGWSLNHYGGEEGFFGWLALQTIKHRDTLRDLSEAEAAALGPVLQQLETGIYDYWEVRRYPVGRVYVMYFLEAQLEPGHVWHLHFHLVPRFNALDASMRDKVDVLAMEVPGIDAYLIAKLRADNITFKLPPCLDRKAFEESNDHAALMRKQLTIVHGVVMAAGFPGGFTPLDGET